MIVTETLDTRGMNCPLPILKAKKALRDLNAGDILRVDSTDPGSFSDFEAFCNTTGNILLSSETVDEVFTYLIIKS